MSELKNNWELYFISLRLLGLNGVGKTTFIKMLIGEIKPSYGEIFLNGFDMNTSYFKARKNIGYCPQFSHLPEFLTVQECLELFSNLKGLDQNTIPYILNDLVKLFKLNELSFKLVQNLRYTYYYNLFGKKFLLGDGF